MKRIRSRRGESLAETIAAILIITLASVGFLTLAQTASRLNAEAQAAEDAYLSEQNGVLTASAASPASVTVTIGGSSVDYSVRAAGGSSEGSLRAYNP